MIKTIKRLWDYLLTNKCSISDMIWQMDADLDALNALVINAEKEIKK